MEKFVNIFVPVFGVALLILLIGSSYGSHMFLSVNYLADNANAAGPYWKILGTILILGSVYQYYRLASDSIKVTTGQIILMGLGLVLGVCANCGFNFAIA